MFLLLDKPKGVTSFDCIRKLQKLYGKRLYDQKIKIGHAGTLDPMATGLMIIAIGKSTKQLGELTGLDKSYLATIDLSQATDTWDDDEWGRRARWTEGEWKTTTDHTSKTLSSRAGHGTQEGSNHLSQEISDHIVHHSSKRGYHLTTNQQLPTRKQITTTLDSFLTRETFLLTPFSAKKINGKKLYEYAREGEPILKQSPMHVKSVELVSYNFPYVQARFHVGSGTYIRSLGFELGRALGWGGILTELRRESVGEWGF